MEPRYIVDTGPHHFGDSQPHHFVTRSLPKALPNTLRALQAMAGNMFTLHARFSYEKSLARTAE